MSNDTLEIHFTRPRNRSALVADWLAEQDSRNVCRKKIEML